MPPIQTSLDFKIKVDQASLQQHAVATAQMRQQYDSLVKSGQSLHAEFLVQGQAANALHAQIANLNDAYRAGRVGQAQYESENARLAAELKKTDSAFGGTTQAIRTTDDAIKGFYKTIQTEGAAAERAVDPAKAALTAQRAQITSLGRTSEGIRAVGRGANVLLGSGVLPVTGAASGVTRAIYGVQALQMEFPKLTEGLLNSGRATTFAVSAVQKYIPGMSQAGAQTAVAAGSIGVMAAATVAMIVAFKIAKNIIDDSKKATEKFINVNQRYAEVIATGTTQDVETAIKKNEDRNRVLQIEREKLSQLVNTAEDTKGFAGALLDVNDALGLNMGGMEDAKNRLKEVDGEIGANTGLNELLTQALKDGTVALNDAAAAEELLRAQRQQTADAALKLIDAQAADELTLREKVATYTVDQTKSEIATLTRQRTAEAHNLGRLRDAYENGDLTLAQFTASTITTMAEIARLNGILADDSTYVMQAAQAREAEAAAAHELSEAHKTAGRGMRDLKEGLAAAAAETANARDELFKYADEQAKVDEERAVKSQREQEDAERKRLQDLADFYVAQADLDTKYYDDRAKLLDDIAGNIDAVDQKRLDEIKDYNQESRRLAQDHKDAILQIQRDTDRDFEDARRNRDTAGALAALRSGERQIDDEKRSYDKNRDRRDEDFRDQIKQLNLERNKKLQAGQQALRDLDAQHRKEKATKEAAFRLQLQREDEQRRIATQRQQLDWQNEDQARATHYGVVEGTLDTHFKTIETKYSSHLANLEAIASGGAPASAYATGGAHYAITEYAGGGTPPLFRRVSVGERQPETAVFASGRRQIVGAHGRESAIFTEPARIYPNTDSGINIHLGGITVRAGGAGARDIARKLSQAEFNTYLEQSINDYIGSTR